MLQKRFLIGTEALSKDISNFTIGFAHLTQDGNIEDAINAGSGTLVTIGSLHGILTAAHVVHALPKHGNVGLILHLGSPAQYRRNLINMDHTEDPVVMKANKFDAIGPDLAFLKLTDETLGALKATSSFYSLSKRRDDVLSHKMPTKSNTDCITGIIHELTEEAPSKRPGVRRVNFHTIFCGVRPSAVRYLCSHDLVYFQLAIEHEPAFEIPNSFEGTSGGAVWRFYVTERDGKAEVADRRLVAVPFHQSFTAEGKREITCQGSTSIYGSLVDQIVARWPDETKTAPT